MSIYYQDERVTLHHGTCLDVLVSLPNESIDAVCTDPPYGLSNTDPQHVADTIVRWVNGDREYLPPVKGGFMGQEWDSFVPPVAVWDECLRVLKPGGHLLAFAGPRTMDLMGLGIRLAGFDIRDSIAWLYGSGFPKSMDVSKAIDKAAGAERASLGVVKGAASSNTASLGVFAPEYDATAPATPDAERWQGWGSAMKPAFEPVVVARKPLIGTIAQNVLAYGTGALNIDATRVRPDGELSPPAAWPAPAQDSEPCTCAERPACSSDGTGSDRESATPRRTPGTPEEAPAGSAHARRSGRPASAPGRASDRLQPQGSQGGCPSSLRSDGGRARETPADDRASAQPPPDAGTSPDRCATCGRIRSIPSMPYGHSTTPHVERQATLPAGRWPTNVVLDDSQAAALDEQSGESVSKPNPGTGKALDTQNMGWGFKSMPGGFDDQGGASRFFPTFRYEAKAPTSERPRVNGVAHPTVKPLELLRWLVRLVTPPGGTVLEPFAGSGTTVEACIIEGFRCITIEREADYLPLITQRIHRRLDPLEAVRQAGGDLGLFDFGEPA